MKKDLAAGGVVVLERHGMLGQRIVDRGLRKRGGDQAADLPPIVLAVQSRLAQRTLHDAGQEESHKRPIDLLLNRAISAGAP